MLPSTEDQVGRQSAVDSDSFPIALRAFGAVALLLEAICLGVEFICRHIPGLARLPYTGYLLPSSDNYADYMMFYNRFRHFHSDEFFLGHLGNDFLYPPAAGSLYKLLYSLGGAHNLRWFLSLIGGVYALAGVLLYRAMRRRGAPAIGSALFLLICAACSYPLFFEFNRANIELFVCGLSALGLFAFLRGRLWLAAALFGWAGALKFYPLIYLGLLLARRQIRQVVAGIVTFAVVTLASLWSMTPHLHVAVAGVRAGLKEFADQNVNVHAPQYIGLDHSLVALVKRWLPHMPEPATVSHVTSVYLLIAAVTGTVVYVLRIRKLPVVNQVMCLVAACILLPPTSYDYTLQHLYLPWSMMVLLAVVLWRRGVPPPAGFTATLGCLVLLLGPENEFILHGERFGGQIKAVTLLVLFLLALRYPLASEFDEHAGLPLTSASSSG